MATIIGIIVVIFIVLVIGLPTLFKAFKVIKQYERGIVLRFGRFSRTLEPGLRFVLPYVDTVQRVDMRVAVIQVAKQDVITKDNVPVTLDAVVYLQVVDPKKSFIEVQDYKNATSTMAQTLLRGTIGAHSMDELLTQQKKLDSILRSELDQSTSAWGIKVTSVEIRSMDLPEGLKRAMAKEAEAERERKAKVIAADGELLASEKISAAAGVISENPSGIMLRMLQTLTEISAEKNSTILFPIPIEMLEFFKSSSKK